MENRQSEKPIIEVHGLKKKYRLGVIGTGSLSHDLSSWWAKVRKKEDPNSLVTEERYSGDSFWALNGVDFSVQRGESVGIIGSNGAGKSTLLKILSRVTSPTEGNAVLRGSLTSMLEIGTGFNGELTGRENIYLNGAILGMSKAEIDSKIEEIIDFSECREFIDTPVKRYSSGMYVKLAFSVASHLDSDILVMDEVLAVGDVKFQRKCISKMIDTIRQDNKTVLYVSHNMATVEELCTRCIVLDAGRIVFDGDPRKAIAIYSGQFKESFVAKEFTDNDFDKYAIYVRSVELLHKEGIEFTAGEPIQLKVIWGNNYATSDLNLGAIIMKGSRPVSISFSKPFTPVKGKAYSSILTIPTDHLPVGKYGINLSFFKYTTPDLQSFYIQRDFFIFRIGSNPLQEGASWREDLWGDTAAQEMTVQSEELESGGKLNA